MSRLRAQVVETNAAVDVCLLSADQVFAPLDFFDDDEFERRSAVLSPRREQCTIRMIATFQRATVLPPAEMDVRTATYVAATI